jgi:hypothetical protein
MGCYHCQSVNGSDPRCEDSFFNNFGDSVYQSDCKAGKNVIKLVMEKMKISDLHNVFFFFFWSGVPIGHFLTMGPLICTCSHKYRSANFQLALVIEPTREICK